MNFHARACVRAEFTIELFCLPTPRVRERAREEGVSETMNDDLWQCYFYDKSLETFSEGKIIHERKAQMCIME